MSRKKWKNLVSLFCLGGAVYVTMELLYRHKSHPSMFIAGGLSVALIDLICNGCAFFKKRNLIIKAITGSVIITTIEYVTGLIVNITMKLGVWSYSHMPFNLNGQICLPLSILWALLSIPAIYIGKFVSLEE